MHPQQTRHAILPTSCSQAPRPATMTAATTLWAALRTRSLMSTTALRFVLIRRSCRPRPRSLIIALIPVFLLRCRQMAPYPSSRRLSTRRLLTFLRAHRRNSFLPALLFLGPSSLTSMLAATLPAQATNCPRPPQARACKIHPLGTVP